MVKVYGKINVLVTGTVSTLSSLPTYQHCSDRCSQSVWRSDGTHLLSLFVYSYIATEGIISGSLFRLVSFFVSQLLLNESLIPYAT